MYCDDDNVLNNEQGKTDQSMQTEEISLPQTEEISPPKR